MDLAVQADEHGQEAVGIRIPFRFLAWFTGALFPQSASYANGKGGVCLFDRLKGAHNGGNGDRCIRAWVSMAGRRAGRDAPATQRCETPRTAAKGYARNFTCTITNPGSHTVTTSPAVSSTSVVRALRAHTVPSSAFRSAGLAALGCKGCPERTMTSTCTMMSAPCARQQAHAR